MIGGRMEKTLPVTRNYERSGCGRPKFVDRQTDNLFEFFSLNWTINRSGGDLIYG